MAGESTTGPQGSAPSGLGGWLILVAIGLAVSPVRLVLFLGQTFVPIFRDGAWAVLTTPGSPGYHPLWAPLLVFELVGNAGFVVAQLVLLVLFFRRSRRFTKGYIWVALVNLPFIVADAWLSSLVRPDGPMLDASTARELARSAANAAIWVPYMFVSRRVRNTFVA